MEQSGLIHSSEDQLRRFGALLQNYDERLREFLSETNRGVKNYNTSMQKNFRIVNTKYSTNQETLPLLELLASDKLLSKIILTFAHLCHESVELSVQVKRIQLQFLYLDEDLCSMLDAQCDSGVDICYEPSSERFLLKLTDIVECLCKIQFVIERCTILANNLLLQCGTLLASETTAFKLFDVIDSIAIILVNIVIFDEILPFSTFNRSWRMYKKTLVAIAHKRNFQEYASASDVNELLNFLDNLDFLFSGSLLQTFLDNTFAVRDTIGTKGMISLKQQFNEYINHNFNLIERLTFPDLNEFTDAHLIIQINVVWTALCDFCEQYDSKQFKSLLEVNAKYSGLTLVGNIPWKPEAFFRKHAERLPKTFKKLIQQNKDKRHMQKCLNERVSKLQRDYKSYCSQIALWLLHVQKSLQPGAFDLNVEQAKELATLLLQGLQYTGRLGFLIKLVVNAHVSLCTPMSKATLIIVCKFVEIMKSVHLMFRKNTEGISEIVQCILQHLQYEIIYILTACKKKIVGTTMNDRDIDTIASLKIAEKCMNGPPTKIRVIIMKLAITSTNPKNLSLIRDQAEILAVSIGRIGMLANFQDYLKESCDLSIMLYHQSILPSYLKQVIEKRKDFNSFQFVIQAMNDCSKDLVKVIDSKLIASFQKSNFENIRKEIIIILCAKIETYLRLEVHSNLHLESTCPYEQGTIADYRALINMVPIEIDGRYVIVKDHLENYLSIMFYNLTTITLHDWKTYEEMRQIAKFRMHLNPVKDYLPNQTLEQGVDILQIMRNIQVFVSEYVYNMHTQIFVLQKSKNKHLDTIGIRHIANSLRTHGIGVINTTINYTYQFLRQKFYTFSQFLYDEQIKSRLMKELRMFSERKQDHHYPLYPYERADAFNKDIRNLGLSGDGQTYIDLFRNVITHIGNAIGYIRLIRSGSIHANYSAHLYLPNFKENLEFFSKSKQETLLDVTINAAENLEINIQNLVKSFSVSTDYFKILVEAFQPFFRNPHNIHLKIFYLIIPPLTLNYIEYILSAKDKINKKSKHGPVFFDDGFAVGLAYILKLLDQISDFNSLQWFGTVRSRFDAEYHKIKEITVQVLNFSGKGSTSTSSKKIENEKLQQTLALTERRINAYRTNFNLLYYNICSAKILFQ